MKKEDVYARMMHTPDDPARAELRAALRDIWTQLLPLHRALINAARDEYAANVAPVSSPTHLIQLLQEEPLFSWLKPLTAVIVDLDTMSRTDFERAEADALLARVTEMFGNGGGTGEFAERYVPMLQRDVDVAIAHAAIRQILLRMSEKRA